MRVLGIIPARGGSRGIPRKNLAIVGGKTLLRRAIEGAQKAKSIARLIVSTDCREVADEAQRYDCAVEFRPDELATDNATTLAVLQWHVNQSDEKPDAVLCLQPTCPLRQPSDIDGAIGTMQHTSCDSVISYVEVGGWHPVRMADVNPFDKSVSALPAAFVNEDGHAIMFAQRQKLPAIHLRSGDIYLTRTSVLETGSLTGTDCRAWVIDHQRHCNVDRPIDLVVAEALVEYHGCK